MEAEAAKYIGAGIACLGMAGAGIGLGHIFGNYLAGAWRNPSAAQGQFSNLTTNKVIDDARRVDRKNRNFARRSCGRRKYRIKGVPTF